MYEKSFMHRDVITHVVRPRRSSGATTHALTRRACSCTRAPTFT
jgi:hypothetical protein